MCSLSSRIPCILAHVIDKHAFEFHDRLPHLEGEGHFKFMKCIISNDLGSPNESHHLDIIDFNTPKCPRIVLH